MRIKNKSTVFIALFALVLLLLPISTLQAASVRQVSMDDLIMKSQFVFEGTVTGIETRENSQRRIHTYVTFSIDDTIKGNYGRNFITLSFLGGTVGNLTMAVSDMIIPQMGEHGIYFVESPERTQVNPLYGWSQGHFILERDSAGVYRVMTNRKSPVLGIAVKSSSKLLAPEKQGMPHLSSEVSSDVITDRNTRMENAITVGDFKMIIHSIRGDVR